MSLIWHLLDTKLGTTNTTSNFRFLWLPYWLILNWINRSELFFKYFTRLTPSTHLIWISVIQEFGNVSLFPFIFKAAVVFWQHSFKETCFPVCLKLAFIHTGNMHTASYHVSVGNNCYLSKNVPTVFHSKQAHRPVLRLNRCLTSFAPQGPCLILPCFTVLYWGCNICSPNNSKIMQALFSEMVKTLYINCLEVVNSKRFT